jgi:hypothetical protein
MVKKVLADGSPCRKCADVMAKLEQSGHIERIAKIVIADETDPNSEGMKLAREYNVDRAPFFIVQEDNRAAKIYTVYYKLVLEVLDA